jgi:hypothetical protein
MFMQNLSIYLGESSFCKSFSPTGTQKVHEEKTGKFHQNEHATQRPKNVKLSKLFMAYSSFTIAQVKRQFNLKVIKGSFFADLPPLSPRTWFREYLQESASFAAGQGSEKVRSELIVAPLLFELRVLLNRQIGLFSGVDFSVDAESGLNGVCDFLLTRSTDELIIEAPAIILIEAKKGELNAGWGQCAAEMIAAQKFNLANGVEVATIYGSVTTGIQWQFLKLTERDLTIDTTEYSLDPIDRILGILKWMVDNN